MIRRQSLISALLALVLIVLLVNIYTIIVFVRGATHDKDVLSVTESKYLFYNDSIGSIRFRKSAGGEINLLVPVEFTGKKVILNALRILEEYQQITVNETQASAGYVHVVGRLSRVLTRSVNLVKSNLDPKEVWSKISQWPFNDLLRMANMGELSTYANKAKILQAKNSKKGTQLKIEVMLEGDQLALFKPQWYPRDVKIVGKAFSGKDRHFGEIASFYLNLILGYNVAPITVGRNVNLMAEILPYASQQLRQTFYRENRILMHTSVGTSFIKLKVSILFMWCLWETFTDGSLCFYGQCYYCSARDVVCRNEEDVVEGAMVLMLDKRFKMLVSPWKRIYKDGNFAQWETDMNFCSTVLKDVITPMRRREMILDMIAIHVFDFLIGNGDRHHFEVLRRNDPNANGHSRNFVLIDNGKSFGNPHEDFIDILAPLYQCCAIRESLYSTLKKFQGSLGKSLEVIGAVDPIQPLLTPAHFRALDRRLSIVLATIRLCRSNEKKSEFGRVIW